MNKKFIITLLILATIIGFLLWQFPYSLNNTDNKYNIIYLLVICCSLLMGLSNSNNLPTIIRYFGYWLVIIVILFSAYSYRDVLMNSRLISNLMPMRPVTLDNGSFMLSVAEDGHFHTEAIINNKTINCLVDTGASNIAIGPEDAMKIGFDISQLQFDTPVSTANGRGMTALVILDSLQVGPILLHNVHASIIRESMGQCLLGMSFLRKLQKFSISQDQLIITP